MDITNLRKDSHVYKIIGHNDFDKFLLECEMADVHWTGNGRATSYKPSFTNTIYLYIKDGLMKYAAESFYPADGYGELIEYSFGMFSTDPNIFKELISSFEE